VQKQTLREVMASCVRNIRTNNYQNLITGFQVTVENVGDVFLRQCNICTVVNQKLWDLLWQQVAADITQLSTVVTSRPPMCLCEAWFW